MRLLAYIMLLITLGAAGWAGQLLWQEWQEWQVPVAVVLPEGSAPVAPDAAPQPEAPPRFWPALFGEKQPPPPPEPEPEPPAPEPQPPAPKAPPLDSLGYELKGVVRAEGAVWALVAHPTGERILRVGDTLEHGLIVMEITEEGVWIGPEGGEPELLKFPE